MTAPRSGARTVLLVVAAVVLLGFWWWSAQDPGTSSARPGPSASPQASGTLATVPVGDLPAEARATLALIEAGGPFPYSRDGVVFQNRERLLQVQRRGYYHEYTVRTPGEGDRGARRIVTGTQGERYYSDDHYDSFRIIEEEP